MVKKIFLIVCLAILIFLGINVIVPNVSQLKKGSPGKTSFMEVREREWKAEGKKIRIKQVWVPLSRISPYLIKAVIIAEDDKFWKHEGFDYEAIQKAAEKDIKAGKFKAGGSTISQQLAKNLYLTPSKNPFRKIKEAILTWRIERTLTKKRIIELYLNLVEWGEGIFGIEAAARHYYGKSAEALSPEEAACLAVVLPNPRKLNPLGNSRYVSRRAGMILAIMVKRGLVIPVFDEVMAPEKEAEKRIGPEEIGGQSQPPPVSEPSKGPGGEDRTVTSDR